MVNCEYKHRKFCLNVSVTIAYGTFYFEMNRIFKTACAIA